MGWRRPTSQRAGLPRASEAAGEVKQGGGGVGGSARPHLGGEARRLSLLCSGSLSGLAEPLRLVGCVGP